MSRDLHSLPPNLPVPQDDGACDHLDGMWLPELVLESSLGPVNVADVEVLFVYPRAGHPDRPSLPGWDEIPGARGCTPQTCAFRDAHDELREFGVRVAGLSAQSLDDQCEFAQLHALPFPVIADPELRLADALDLPTFDVEGLRLYKRVTLVARSGQIEKVFYPVFPPDRNAQEVLDWLDS